MTFEEFIKSKKFKIGFCVTLCVLVAFLIFGAGVFVGLEKAKFSYRFSDNYYRTFTRPVPGPIPGGPKMFMLDHEYMNPHGSGGTVIKVGTNSVTIKEDSGLEKNIIVESDTSIKDGRMDLKLNALKINDQIVVIGSPDNNGEITAKLIRVIPNPLQ